ncbi:TonB-dependent receptor [Flammeovirga agarivorans]|uniref:TonB-dependent receptor n=1 Tax=Flammeovirga agarivorans TaxID=2726742 RepID=A0A7X8SR10_9BACT|nr:TonB-dependent receptor [Flammeovirga agarivorans]NLR94780.1 TonB-dependent receptor [Flammeovirga agarivorans]
MKNLIFLILLTSIGLTSWAQKGTISGTVYDAETGEEIIGASVIINGTTTGASTDIFGKFSFPANQGEHEILATFIGYKATTQTVLVKEGQTSTIQFSLGIDAQELDAVEIVGKANKESSEALMVERKNSDVMIQSIGAEEMSVKGISDVEGAMTQISGVSKVSGKGLFVRGLGDRYNNATMNGLPIPSTNPDLKMIPLSIFPSDLVKNISVSKTASPELYGDFSGANVDIILKDYPDEPFFTFGVSGTYNSQATFQDFKTHADGQFEGLGFNGNARPMPPGGVPPTIGNEVGTYETSWSPSTVKAPIAINFNTSGGKFWNIGSEGGIGFVASLAHNNKYEHRSGKLAAYNAQASPTVDYERDQWIYSTNTSALANLTFKINNRHKFNINNILVNESFNTVDENYGYHRDFDQNNLLVRRNTYIQNTIWVAQFTGDHSFLENDRLNFNWGVSRSETSSQEPDRKQLLFTGKGENVNLFTLNPVDNHRYWGDMGEVEYAAKGEIKYGLGAFDRDSDKYRSNLRLGYQGKVKTREFNWYQTGLYGSGANGIDSENPNDQINKWLQDGTLEHRPYRVADTYFKAEMEVHSFYTGYDYDIIPNRLKMNVGIRTEVGRQYVKYRLREDALDAPFRENVYNSTEFLPSANFKYTINEQSNMRFAASKTITRPGMREIIPFEYQSVAGGESIIGNPNLRNAENYNLDLKYEIFPNSGEIFAIGAFGKLLDNPIERVTKAAAGNLYTYENVGEAVVAGIELEFQKKLDNVFNTGSTVLQNTTFGINGTLMYSRMKIGDDVSTVVTNRERALQGASPYILNTNIGYNQEWLNGDINSSFMLNYTTFGDRLYASGSYGAGDIYEKSFGTLDLIIRNKIKKNLSLNISAKNLLNPSIERYQEFDGGITKPISSYKRGMEIGIGLSYTF